MEAVLVLFVCLQNGGGCSPIVGQQTALTECLAMSQAVAAGWMVANPGYEFKGLACVDPKELAAILGKRSA